MLRKVAGCRGKIERNAEWEAEYNAVMGIMKNQMKLSPYDPTKKLKLIIDRAKTVGTGFLHIQNINDDEPKKGVNIINAGSCLLPEIGATARWKLRLSRWTGQWQNATIGYITVMKLSY